jgi:hypothetical protein
VRSREAFVDFVLTYIPRLERSTVIRIVDVAETTYRFDYTQEALSRRRIEAPITIFKATGDQNSFIEDGHVALFKPPTVVCTIADHYDLLRETGVDEICAALSFALPQASRALS